MFGRAVADRAVVLTGDYLADPAFTHAEDTDRVVRDIGIRSMVVAPVVAGDEVYGALGTFSSRPDAFSPAQIGLVRALADHAAAAMSNVRLIEALDGSRGELAKRADVERTLREIGARISAASDLPAVLQLSVDEAARLMDADGARIDLIDPVSGLLHGAYASGSLEPQQPLPDDPDETIDQGVAGQAVVTGGPFWTGDYLRDPRFRHLPVVDRFIEASGIRSVMAVPLTDEDGSIGALLVSSGRPDAWSEPDASLLTTIADQASITIRTTRLIAELDRSRDALARRAGAEQGLREIAARITVLREPGEILQDVVKQAGRLVRADGVILDLLDPATGNLHWALDDGLSEAFSVEERASLWISVGVGATGKAVAEDRVVVADDDLAELFPPSPESTEFYARTGFHSMIAAPITGESGPLGVIEVYSKAARRVHRHRRRAGRGARQPGRHRDHQRPAHRGARALARRARPDGRCRADVARDRRPGQRDARPGRDPPGGHRRVGPAARGDRRREAERGTPDIDGCDDVAARVVDRGRDGVQAHLELAERRRVAAAADPGQLLEKWLELP